MNDNQSSGSPRTAVITGASRGLGKAIAEEFAAEGYHVAILSRNYDSIQKAASEISSQSLVLPYACDIRDGEMVAQTLSDINRITGSIDVLVNNAGVNCGRSLDPSNEWYEGFHQHLDAWKQEMDTNLTGAFICAYLAAGYMIKQGSGSIINLSSIMATESATSPGYGASKAGMIKLTKDLSTVLSPRGVRVNCIAFGYIDMGMTYELPDEFRKRYLEKVSQGRFGRAEEITKVVLFLASDNASFATGATWDVNGGYS